MKILALVTEAYGASGGIAQYNRDFIGALAETRADAIIDVLPRRAKDEGRAAADRVRLRTPRAGKAAYAIGAGLFALAARPDVIVCGHLHIAPLAAFLARLTKARLIVQLHGIEVWTRPSRSIRRAVESADLVLSVSRDTRRRVLGWSNLAVERAVVLANTVSDAFTPGDGRAMRARLGLGEARALLSVGRLDSREAYKGQDRTIAALPELIARGLDVVFLVAGEGDDRRRLEALAKAAGVADRVRFLGAVPGGELADLYRAADLFVFPSTGEGFGIVFLEAMACGTPAMGLPVGGASDALGDGRMGWLVSEQTLAQSIFDALQTPAPDPVGLARAVRARFGRAVFARTLSGLMSRLDADDSAVRGATIRDRVE